MDSAFKIVIILFISGIVIVGCGSKNTNNQEQQETVGEEKEIVVGETEDLQEKSDFLITAYLNNQLQLALGEVANRNAMSPEVKELSTQILAESQQIQSNFQDLAQAAEIDLNPALTPEYLSIIDTIQTYEGAKFDSAFIYTVIDEHKNDIERLNEWATSTSNPIIRQEVTENVKLLQTQLSKAEAIKDSIN